MRYLVLASDYDGTLAKDGRLTEAVVAALRRLRESGRKTVLVTGRRLEELQSECPELPLFNLVVAENGALLLDPETHVETLLGPAPNERLVEELRNRGVNSLAVGRVIVATWQPFEQIVIETIRDLGLELQVIFNKGAVMILPAGVNKASGLAAALAQLGLSPHNVVGIGDGENDHALLELCEMSVATQNAVASLKERADWTTRADHGDGVIELIDQLLQDDLHSFDGMLRRYHLRLGQTESGDAVTVSPNGTALLLAGTSGAGKTTWATSFLEQLKAKEYQFCLIDPEGDYADLNGALVLGEMKRPPVAHEVVGALRRPQENCVVNLVGITPAERPAFFERLLADLVDLRSKTGRPHWLVLDEAHHLIPSTRHNSVETFPTLFGGVLLVTVEPKHITAPVLRLVSLIVAIGQRPHQTIESLSQAIGVAAPSVPDRLLSPGEGIAWWVQPTGEAFWLQGDAPQQTHQRHIRKYAEGDVGLGAFVFCGPDQRLKLRAQNLTIFLQIADGVDDPTFDHHLLNGDYERWFRWIIKDRRWLISPETSWREVPDRPAIPATHYGKRSSRAIPLPADLAGASAATAAPGPQAGAPQLAAPASATNTRLPPNETAANVGRAAAKRPV